MQLPAALTPMGTSTLGLDFASMTPLIWQYARAFFNDVSPIMIWVAGAIIVFFVAAKAFDILSGNTATKINKPASTPAAFDDDDDDEHDDDDDDEE